MSESEHSPDMEAAAAPTSTSTSTETTTDAARASAVRSDRPWPSVLAGLTAWALPATTALHTTRLALSSAALIHVAAGLATCLLIFFLMGLGSVLEITSEIVEEFVRAPSEATLTTAIAILSIELGFVALALTAMGWGARDERLRASLANAFRQTWLHTPHAIPVVLIVGLLAIAYDEATTAYHNSPAYQDSYSSGMAYPKPPTVPSNADPKSQAWKDYQAAQEQFKADVGAYHLEASRHWRMVQRQSPFLVRFGPFIITLACVASGTWILWSLMRGVGAPRPAPPIARPPTCERCGYNLTTMPLESRCPECGTPIIESLGPDIRPGVAWEHRRSRGRLRTYGRTCVDALRRPTVLGRQIAAAAHRPDCRGFMVAHLVLVFVLAAGSITWVMWLIIPDDQWTYLDMWESLMLVLLLYGSFAVLSALATVALLVLIVALTYRLKLGRNLAGVAMQVAAYQSLYLVAWTAVSGGLGVLVAFLYDRRILDALEDFYFLDAVWVITLLAGMINLLLAVCYLVLIFRGTSAARYANR